MYNVVLISLMFVLKDIDNNEASELSMKNVGGVFIVLCSGVGVAAILATLEMFWTLWKTTSKEKVRTKPNRGVISGFLFFFRAVQNTHKYTYLP